MPLHKLDAQKEDSLIVLSSIKRFKVDMAPGGCPCFVIHEQRGGKCFVIAQRDANLSQAVLVGLDPPQLRQRVPDNVARLEPEGSRKRLRNKLE